MVDFLFLVILALIPVQTNKFFFLANSYVFGIPIDYRAISIYVIDFVLIAYIISFLITDLKKFKKKFNTKKIYGFALLAITAYLVLDSILFSPSKPISVIFSLKITFFGLFSFFASFTLEKKEIWPKIIKVLSFSLIWEFAVAFLEFINQRSIGLWFLGERTFDTTTPNIAHINLFGNLLLRPYGTFPHPNILGIFFVIYTVLFFSIKIPSRQLTKNFKKTIFIVGFLGILISFSKDALISIFAAYTFFATKIPQFLKRGILLILVLIGVSQYIIRSDISSLAERILLMQASLNITGQSFLFGVGSNNFIPKLAQLNLISLSSARLLQPVHNVFLLILAENGVIGLAAFILFLIVVLRYATRPYKLALFIVLLIGLSIDHFFWTLEQCQILFFLSTAAIAANRSDLINSR